MSVASKQDGKKWIQTGVALTCIFAGTVIYKFLEQLSEWFELESKVTNFSAVAQGISVVLAVVAFMVIMKNEKSSVFLKEVYNETMKVVFPDKNQTVNHTIKIMIGVTIIGFILGAFDLSASYLLSLVH